MSYQDRQEKSSSREPVYTVRRGLVIDGKQYGCLVGSSDPTFKRSPGHFMLAPASLLERCGYGEAPPADPFPKRVVEKPAPSFPDKDWMTYGQIEGDES